ncbi:MAG: hypothetical protein RLZZ206_2915 [Cyanobacteriota bacterium]|jgi:hypothetical protein
MASDIQPGEDAAIEQVEDKVPPWNPRIPAAIQTTSRRESIAAHAENP